MNQHTFTELLAKAARLASEGGTDLESFLQAAWSNYLDATPGLREEIDRRATLAKLEELRERGLVAEA